MVELVGEDAVPADWDTLDEDGQQTLLKAEESGSEAGQSQMVARADRIPRTIAFTVLALGQIFHVMSIHAGDKRSFFRVWFSQNQFMLWAVLSTFVLQLAVIYIPFLQSTFETYPMRLPELAGDAVDRGADAVRRGVREVDGELRGGGGGING